MTKELSWFTARVGGFVLRGNNEVFISSDEVAEKLYKVQDEKKGYVFTEKVKIHKARPEECLSCSA